MHGCSATHRKGCYQWPKRRDTWLTKQASVHWNSYVNSLRVSLFSRRKRLVRPYAGQTASDQAPFPIPPARTVVAGSRSELHLLAKRSQSRQEPSLHYTGSRAWAYPAIRATNAHCGNGLPICRQPVSGPHSIAGGKTASGQHSGKQPVKSLPNKKWPYALVSAVVPLEKHFAP